MKLNNFPYAGSPVVAGVAAIIVVLLVIKVFDISYPISITTKAVSSELSVVGEGKVEAVPDIAQVSAGIVADGATVEAVEQKINEVNNAVVSALTNLGIAEEDIKTASYSISPNYNFETGRNIISGYSGNSTLTIKVKNIKQLPQVITAATAEGANQIYNTQYTIDDPAKYREEARNKAIENAKEQARKLSGELGIKLGKIVNIVESTPGPDRIVPLFSREAGLGGAPDLQPGSQTITSIVTLYFERR